MVRTVTIWRCHNSFRLVNSSDNIAGSSGKHHAYICLITYVEPFKTSISPVATLTSSIYPPLSVCLNALFTQSDVWQTSLSPSLSFQSALPVDQAVCKRNWRAACLWGTLHTQCNIELSVTGGGDLTCWTMKNPESLGHIWINKMLLRVPLHIYV